MDVVTANLLKLSEQYREAALIIAANGKVPFPPLFFCAMRSVELAFKAYLTSKGVSESELKKRLGHDLTKIYNAAVEKGIVRDGVNLNDVDEETLGLYSKLYREKELEYSFPSLSVPPLNYWTDLAQEIILTLKGEKPTWFTRY